MPLLVFYGSSKKLRQVGVRQHGRSITILGSDRASSDAVLGCREESNGLQDVPAMPIWNGVLSCLSHTAALTFLCRQ